MTDSSIFMTWGGDLATLPRWERLVLGAFKLAMAQHEVPEHPGGKCPAPDCNCVTVGAHRLAARAEELLADPYISDAQLCEDCKVLVPMEGNCYAIDCGQVVCPACGEKRGLTEAYKLGPWEPQPAA